VIYLAYATFNPTVRAELPPISNLTFLDMTILLNSITCILTLVAFYLDDIYPDIGILTVAFIVSLILVVIPFFRSL
jgi:hypothetical protein